MRRNDTTKSLAALIACASAGAAGAQVCEPRWSDEFKSGADRPVQALHATSEALYAGGWFLAAGGVPAARVAAYDSGGWSALGPGFVLGTSCDGAHFVQSLLEVDLPGAAGLIAGGAIAEPPGGEPVGAIARWDGSAWQSMGGGVELRYWADGCPDVRAMAVFDDGSGPALYITGLFNAPVEGIARWNGAEWEQVGGGRALVGEALQAHDDGSGPALYAAVIIAEPVSANFARWDGVRWSEVGEGPGGLASDLVEVEVDGRTVLAAALTGSGRGRVVVWDGATWDPLGPDFDDGVHALAVFDDGSGPALYAGGQFTSSDGRAIRGLAKWDDAAGEWIEAAGGVDGFVYALEPAPHEGVWSLVVGGYFQTAGGGTSGSVASQNIARLIGCAAVCYPDCDSDGDLTFFDFLCFQNEFAAQTPYADCDGSGAHDFFDFLCFQNAFAAGCP
jgi:trimeric autotransporter adhesin